MWVPLFVAFFALVADASFLFFGQNRAYRIVQEANRMLSVGRLGSEDEVEAYVLTRLSNLAPGATVIAQIAQGTVTTNLTIPADNMIAVGLFTALTNLDITVGASHLIEF